MLSHHNAITSEKKNKKFNCPYHNKSYYLNKQTITDINQVTLNILLLTKGCWKERKIMLLKLTILCTLFYILCYILSEEFFKNEYEDVWIICRRFIVNQSVNKILGNRNYYAWEMLQENVLILNYCYTSFVVIK